MLTIFTLLISVRSVVLLTIIIIVIDYSRVVFVALVTLGSVNFDLFEGPVHERLTWRLKETTLGGLDKACLKHLTYWLLDCFLLWNSSGGSRG